MKIVPAVMLLLLAITIEHHFHLLLYDNSFMAVISTNGYSKAVSEMWMVKGLLTKFF